MSKSDDFVIVFERERMPMAVESVLDERQESAESVIERISGFKFKHGIPLLRLSRQDEEELERRNQHNNNNNNNKSNSDNDSDCSLDRDQVGFGRVVFEPNAIGAGCSHRWMTEGGHSIERISERELCIDGQTYRQATPPSDAALISDLMSAAASSSSWSASLLQSGDEVAPNDAGEFQFPTLLTWDDFADGASPQRANRSRRKDNGNDKGKGNDEAGSVSPHSGAMNVIAGTESFDGFVKRIRTEQKQQRERRVEDAMKSYTEQYDSLQQDATRSDSESDADDR
jgi:hypothetical protein